MAGNDNLMQKYLRILQKYPEMAEAARRLADKYNEDICRITALVSAPVIYMYADHIVTTAVRLGIKRIYFLARDGYSVKRAAEEIVKKRGVNVELRYFYCSRFSLRMAAYGFKDDSAYDRLFFESYELSAKKLLARAGFSPEDRETVYKDIGFSLENEDAPLDRAAFHELCGRIKGSGEFDRIIKEKSDRAFLSAVSYIRQEGMGEYSHIAVADLGWTGSMQHTLKRILHEAGIETEITGFYMGLLEAPPIEKGSEFDGWLFSNADSGVKAWFSHNLMECICTAPHGMTLGYENINGTVTPVLCDCENNADRVKMLSDIIAEFAEKVCTSGDRETALALLKALMYTPEVSEAAAFAAEYHFCDDVSEEYHRSIAGAADKELLTQRLLHRQVFDRIFKKKRSVGGLYWYYGSLALSNVKNKGAYRLLFRLSEQVRFFIKQKKGKR